MASHVVRLVYWGGNDHTVSSVLSSTPSIVSVDSVVSHERETSSTVQGATGPTSTRDSLARRMSSLLAKPSRSETSTSAGDDSFTRHHTYFFKDGNVTFLVDGTLYCVHQYFFSRDSVYFSTRFDQLGVRDHEALPITISLGNIECKDFDAFLSILYPKNFEQRDLSYEEWKSVLHLSTRWDFASIRRLALNNIQPPTPHDRLLLARTYSVNDWLVPALSELCERRAPLSLVEARQMDIEDVVLISTVREDIRDHAPPVDVAVTPRRVEAAQAGKPIPPAVPTTRSGAVEHTPSLTSQKRASNGYESDGEAMVGSAAVDNELVWIHGIDKGFQEKQEVQEDIDVRKERLAQLMEDSQAEVMARYEARVEAVRHMVKEAERKAKAEEMKRKEAAEHEAEAAKGKLEAEAAEVARRQAEAARVVAKQRQADRLARLALQGKSTSGSGSGPGNGGVAGLPAMMTNGQPERGKERGASATYSEHEV